MKSLPGGRSGPIRMSAGKPIVSASGDSNVAMSESLAAIERCFGGTHFARRPRGGSIKDALLFFKETGWFRNYREGRYVCVGASIELSGWSLLSDRVLMDKALFLVRISEFHQGMRFYFALLSNLRSFSGDGTGKSTDCKFGLSVLGQWLAGHRSTMTAYMQTTPGWWAPNAHSLDVVDNRPFEFLLSGRLPKVWCGLSQLAPACKQTNVSLRRAKPMRSVPRKEKEVGSEASKFISKRLVHSRPLVHGETQAESTSTGWGVGLHSEVGNPTFLFRPDSDKSKAANQSGGLRLKTSGAEDNMRADVRARVESAIEGMGSSRTRIANFVSMHALGHDERLDFLSGFAPLIQGINIELGNRRTKDCEPSLGVVDAV